MPGVVPGSRGKVVAGLMLVLISLAVKSCPKDGTCQGQTMTAIQVSSLSKQVRIRGYVLFRGLDCPSYWILEYMSAVSEGGILDIVALTPHPYCDILVSITEV